MVKKKYAGRKHIFINKNVEKGNFKPMHVKIFNSK